MNKLISNLYTIDAIAQKAEKRLFNIYEHINEACQETLTTVLEKVLWLKNRGYSIKDLRCINYGPEELKNISILLMERETEIDVLCEEMKTLQLN